jgi:hypothetical protein
LLFLAVSFHPSDKPTDDRRTADRIGSFRCDRERRGPRTRGSLVSGRSAGCGFSHIVELREAAFALACGSLVVRLMSRVGFQRRVR